MIRFIIHTVSSRTDRNGNCYHFANITSTKTGKRLYFQVNGDRNAIGKVRNLLKLAWKEVFTSEETVMIREWNAYANTVSLFENDITKERLEALEV